MGSPDDPIWTENAVDPDDAQFVAKMRVMAAPTKGVSRGIEGRGQFDAVTVADDDFFKRYGRHERSSKMNEMVGFSAKRRKPP